MSTRHTTVRFEDFSSFIESWEKQISIGSYYFVAGTAPDDLAPEFKLDIVLPTGSRIGPLTGQIVHRAPDGGVGCKLIEPPDNVQRGVNRLMNLVEEIKQWLLEKGDVLDPNDLPKQAVAAPQANPAQAANHQQQGQEVNAPKARGLIIPNVEGRKPDISGLLDDTSLRDTLFELAVGNNTGLITINRGDGAVKYGLWYKGGVVGWRSEPLDEEEVFGILLYRGGHITKEQLAESLDVMEANNCRQGDALIEMGLITLQQMVAILQKQCEFVLQRVMRSDKGKWSYHSLPNLPERFINPPLKVASLLYKELRDHAKSLNREDVFKAIEPFLNSYVEVRDEVLPLLAEIGFSKSEEKFLSIITENSWRLREIFTVTNLPKSQTVCVLWAFNELGILDYKGQEATSRYIKRISDRLASKLRGLARANHFDILEIHWICLPDEIVFAYEKIRDEFDATKYHDITPEMAKAFSKIHKRIELAWAGLNTESKRREYRAEVVEANTITMSAELLAKKGEMMIMKKDRREATMCFSKAAELEPRNSAYKEGLSRARSVIA